MQDSQLPRKVLLTVTPLNLRGVFIVNKNQPLGWFKHFFFVKRMFLVTYRQRPYLQEPIH